MHTLPNSVSRHEHYRNTVPGFFLGSLDLGLIGVAALSLLTVILTGCSMAEPQIMIDPLYPVINLIDWSVR